MSTRELEHEHIIAGECVLIDYKMLARFAKLERAYNWLVLATDPALTQDRNCQGCGATAEPEDPHAYGCEWVKARDLTL